MRRSSRLSKKRKNYVISQEESNSGYTKLRKTSTSDANMFCWGNTINGELGLGGIEEDRVLEPRPLTFSKAAEVVEVACGQNHSVLLTKGGEVYSCGSNDFGQLGREKPCKKPELVDRLDGYNITRTACGAQHSIGVTEWGQVYSWGSDSHGQLGNGREYNGNAQRMPKLVKSLAAIQIVQISCGERHCLALSRDGALYSWGANEYGQLGLGRSTYFESSPRLIQSLKGLPTAFIACGNNHSFAVSKSGAVYGWGKNAFGQLGQNDGEHKLYPCQLKALRSLKVKYVSCGEDFSVFLTKEGGVYSCGAGMFGQLGHGSMTNEFLPKKILELMGSTVTQISCGRQHTLAFVPSKGTIYAFGLGAAGQLGTKITVNTATPQVVLGPWVAPPGTSLIDPAIASGEPTVTVKRIFAGGDHCFTTIAQRSANIPPDDFRVATPANQIMTLTIEKGKEIERLSPELSLDPELLMYIETVFSHLACINSSFLLDNDEHYCCNSRNSGLDLAAVEEFFTSISRCENPGPQHMIMICVREKLLPALSISPPDVETLRVYMILVYYHEFDNPKHHLRLHNIFARHILQLKMEAGRILDKWWLAAPVDFFERMIRIFKSVVVYVISKAVEAHPEYANWDERVLYPLQILYRLHSLNCEVPGLKVPHETFYIPELLEKVDLKSDYFRWLMLQDPMLKQMVYFCDYPFVFDAKAKTLLLQVDQALQMQLAINEAANDASNEEQAAQGGRLLSMTAALTAAVNTFLYFEVTREKIVEDTLRVIDHCEPKELKRPLKVKFRGEEAEDAGGVKKEFFLLLTREILDPKYGMFEQYEETNAIWFNLASFEEDEMYHLIGVLCGLAIYNFTIVDLPFPLALYKKLLNQPVGLKDLEDLAPTVARNLQYLLDYDQADVEEVFALTFEMTKDVFGEVKVIPLKPGGHSVAVTQKNKEEYVDLYVDMVLNKSVEKQFACFSSGFKKVCGGRVLDLFQPHELREVVVGNEDYDWDELERNTEYRHGYHPNDMSIRLFWEVFHELPLAEKKKFLLFLTGTDRIPIQGMQAIKMFIQPIADDRYLPVAHTCFNLLDLPRYRTKEKMRFKLLQAIDQTQGFSLV